MIRDPEVKLLSMTPDYKAMIVAAWYNARTSTTDIWTADKVHATMTDKEITDESNNILIQDLPITEFISFVFVYNNVSRAFVDQADRNRQSAFWEQSFRILSLDTFADEDKFYRPADLVNPSTSNMVEARILYDKTFRIMQEAYTKLIDLGVHKEQARGVLGLHTNTRMNVSINLRVLRGVLSSRSCGLMQAEYWRPIMKGIISELRGKLDPVIIDSFLSPPCDKQGYCPFERDMEGRFKLGKLDSDPNPICSLYLSKYRPDRLREAATAMKDHGITESKFIGSAVDYGGYLGRDIASTEFRSNVAIAFSDVT